MKLLIFFVLVFGCSEFDKYRETPRHEDRRTNPNSGCNITQDNPSFVEIVCNGQTVTVPKGTPGQPGKDGEDSDFSCTSVLIPTGVEVTCTNGQTFVLHNGKDAEALVCDTEQRPDSILVTCSDGNQFVLYNGKDGLSTNGVDGKSVSCNSTYISGGVQVICSDGMEFVVQNGADGKNGLDGANPKDGVDGYSTVFQVIQANQCAAGGSTILLGLDTNRNNILDSGDANITSATVCNGVTGDKGDTGSQGPVGVSPNFTAVEIIDPCGDLPGVLDEILLKLSDGTIIASVSDKANGENTRFSILVPGNYATTDSKYNQCKFTVDASGNITNEYY